MSLRDARLEDLPASLRDLVDLLGLQAAIALVERWGGVTAVYVPKTMTAGHHLAETLGMEAATRLAKAYGGDFLRNIPRAAGALRAARDREVLRMRQAGMVPREIALQHGLTERWVWEIIRKGGKLGARQVRLPIDM